MKRETQRIIDEHKLSYMAVEHEGGLMFAVGEGSFFSVGGMYSKLEIVECGVGTTLDEAAKSWGERRRRKETK